MKEVETRHAPGAIALISGDQPRFHALQASLLGVEVPKGTQYFHASSCNPAKNCNIVVEMLLKDPELRWLWIMGDDHCFEKDALLRLLDRDVDCVVPLTPRRMWPHATVLLKEFEPKADKHEWYAWDEIAEFDSIFPVAACGSAGLLVRRHVFEQLPRRPWFRVGFLGADELGEDLEFTYDCNAAGLTVYCDPTVPMGHLSYVSFYPYRKDGKLGVAANMNGHKMAVVEAGRVARKLKAVA